MRLPTLFKQQKSKTYNYKPRYYNERKERIDAMKRKYETVSDTEYKPTRRASFRDDWKTERKAMSESNTRLRLIVILAFLIMFTFVALRFINFDKLL
ncbi:hypothetical protein SAMN05216480_10791 [Pustulibacterium marinum]|uniref:Uncharacterized protein n=1 Tax=Pustulibacterium marinum TaxID=1224947 RepID=A0A1I7H5P1_9FLAO|nr:hypothetical protein [Pustulibacterium marinum]SFU56003.1 hypothetical protein SAMN05216480_10791 [Pustulibacterium marinum]